MQWLGVSWIDAAMLAGVVVSALVGAWRGFTLEVLSLAGWFVAWFAAARLAPWVAPYLPSGAPGSALNHGLAFASAFIALLLLWAVMARVIATLIGATPLRPLDRLLGAAFGIARGVLVLLALTTLLQFTPAGRSAQWHDSLIAAWLNALLRFALPLTPFAPAAPAPQVV